MDPAGPFEHERPRDQLGAFVVGPGLLSPGVATGPLSGTRFAVKDLFDVAGTRTGAGNPDWLEGARVASAHSPAVAALLGAGAELYGKTVTDELAFSLSGTNVHYGTPANPRAPGHLPGGSSSGSASAVAGGAADLALGTDTAGSVRVPASYCGIFGARPTHGRVSSAGVVALAPSFDTVGALSSSGRLLALAWRALLGTTGRPGAPASRRAAHRLVLAPDLFALADPAAASELRTAASALAEALGLRTSEQPLGRPGDLERWRDAFRNIQLVEAWQQHGGWLCRRKPALGPGVAARFAAAAVADREQASRAVAVRAEVREALAWACGEDALLVQPAAVGPAPPLGLASDAKEALRARTLALSAPAGMAGAPVVSLPVASVAGIAPPTPVGRRGLPVGLALVGLPGDDELLASLAERCDALGLAYPGAPSS